jgi:hypothetical protein
VPGNRDRVPLAQGFRVPGMWGHAVKPGEHARSLSVRQVPPTSPTAGTIFASMLEMPWSGPDDRSRETIAVATDASKRLFRDSLKNRGLFAHDGQAAFTLWRRCCSVCRSKMRHLVCVCLHEGRARRGARDIITTGGMSRQPAEPIDKAQHIRHEVVDHSASPSADAEL